ncbi:response regulator [Candidatus Bathyarchaeota archaeon]|nr:response regulator [Candidatus Bathyarchaeota archaeon]
MLKQGVLPMSSYSPEISTYNILLIEDNPADARLFMEFTKDFNIISCRTTWKQNLKDGMQEIDKQDFDLVLLDLSLPDSNGIDTARKVLSLHLDLPVLVFTGLNDEEIAHQLVAAGVQDYLVKDALNEKILEKTIRYSIDRHSLLENLRHAQAKLQDFNDTLEKKIEIRTRQLQDAQQRLIRQEKLATLGKLAGFLSHELRNPLATINNSVYFLNLVIKEKDNKIGKHLNIIKDEIERAKAFINNLLDFSKVKTITLGRAKLDELIIECLSCVQMPKSIEVCTDFMDRCHEVRMDEVQISQVLHNLLINAIQAMPDGGKLMICTNCTEQYIIVQVEDTGVGIAPDHLNKVFEPLFTTKAKGFGLGLSLSKEIVEMHEGILEVESRIGQGSCFTLKLPRHR